MTNSRIEEVLERYVKALTALKQLAEACPTKTGFKKHERAWRFLDVIVARDGLQKQLEKTGTPAEILEKVSRLDENLRKQFKEFSRNICQKERGEIFKRLENLRDVCEPPETAWWWFPKISVWDRFDSGWDALAIVLLTGSFGILTDISSRLLIGGVGSGIWGSLAIGFQSFVALIGAGSLTTTGQKFINSILKSLRIRPHRWQEAKFGVSFLIFGFVLCVRLSYPLIASSFRKAGGEPNYKITTERLEIDKRDKGLASAESNYKRSLAFNPDDAKTHFYLGSLYEELYNYKLARSEYELAARGGELEAYNNLARLFILDENYNTAACILSRLDNELKKIRLEKKWKSMPQSYKKLNYFFYKNLGWVRMKQERWVIAKNLLREAIDLEEEVELQPKEQVVAAHCLRAQVLEKLDGPEKAKSEWQICHRDVDLLMDPEYEEWSGMAKKRLMPQD